MNRQRLTAITLSVVLAANMMFGLYVYAQSAETAAERKAQHALQQYAQVLKIVRTQYVDESKVDNERLLHGALNGMLSQLDPFSSFVPPRQFTNMNEETEGHFGGIGVLLRVEEDKLIIIQPQEGTPGMKAGLLPGDHVTHVNGEALDDGNMETATNKIKGPPGSTVTLTIYRKSNDTTFDVDIERAEIKLPTVRNVRMLDGNVGYAQITQFGRQTRDELEEALDKLAIQRMSGLVLDLRNNPGGLLDSAIEVSSLFLDPGMLVVSTEGRHAAQKASFYSPKGRNFVRMPMVILINEGSASAAEIVSGCLKDYGRAFLVGEKTYGKGSVQNVIGLDDGSAVRLTTAYYYTPSHVVIHEKGIEPNVVVDVSDKVAAQLARQRNRPQGLPKPSDEPADVDDLQLTQALRLLAEVRKLPPTDPTALEDLFFALEVRPVEQPASAPSAQPVVPEKGSAP